MARKKTATGKKRSIGWYLAHDWQLWVMLLPAIIYIFIFCYVPMYGVQLAFREYDFKAGIYGGKWVGFKYFKQFFDSAMFGTTLRNTFVTAALSIVLGFPAPIVLAMIINQIRQQKWKRIVQTTVYIPYFISTVVMCGMLTLFLNPTSGIFNIIITKLGGESVNFLQDPANFKWIYVLSAVWQEMGWGSIIYFATLSGVDRSLLEAAEIDGANRFQKIWYINVPVLIPTIIILLILQCGSLLSVGYEKVYLLQNTTNLSGSEVISTYVYKVGLEQADFSFGAAADLFNSVINSTILILANFIAKRTTDQGLF